MGILGVLGVFGTLKGTWDTLGYLGVFGVGCPNEPKRISSTRRHAKKWFMQKADSTLRSSRAVPHPSTNRALRRLTSEVGRDPVYSTRYGRQRTPRFTLHQMEDYPQNRSETEKISKHANLLCLTPILGNFKIKNLRCAPGESNRGQKGLHCCNSPTCTLSQNGYGDGRGLLEVSASHHTPKIPPPGLEPGSLG